jgi:Fe-S-cluster containining protein
MSPAGEPLPPLLAAWLGELLGSVPRETRATCDRCAMCSGAEDRPQPRRVYFDPGVKCCSFIPDLHNFLAGAALGDDDPAARAGRERVAQRIKDGVAVTPLGIGKPAVFAVLYDSSTDAFGRSRTLRCPFYIEEGGRCGVWRHRESTCATWFCKHVRGKVGHDFWRGAVLPLLRAIEVELARWCVLEIGLGAEALRHLVRTDAWTHMRSQVSAEALDHRVEERRYAEVWGEWRGRETEYFIRCARLVRDLSWDDVLAIGGSAARAYAGLAQQAYRELTSDGLPARLTVASLELIETSEETTRLSTYSSIDPIEVPNLVMTLLPAFDGRSTEEVLKSIASQTGIGLDPALVRKLVDFGVLVPPERD